MPFFVLRKDDITSKDNYKRDLGQKKEKKKNVLNAKTSQIVYNFIGLFGSGLKKQKTKLA